ncbi:hypothetical protein [Streptomyces sp. ML-6]|uniref:hypothetical protein n=1 Tax=Streptomyces sp. ML-6 TaxID=2982693 RepID=UPI0024C03717|nr:hypothetical protein [Streptomyces sp. ML-6]MDK0523248.1 hypothetical protein [Streptomyces sp. ML-6]
MTPLPGPPPGNAHPGPRTAHATAQPQDAARPHAGTPSPYPTHPAGPADTAGRRTPHDTRRTPGDTRRPPTDTRRTRPGVPADGTARAARQALVALLLAVLAVVGGAPASAFPARPFAGVPPSEAHSPGGHRPTPHTDRTTRTGIVGDTRRTRAGTAPDTRRGRTATATDHHRPAPTTGPEPRPRAGADQARPPHHLPAPGSPFTLPGTLGLRAPDRARPRAPEAASPTIDRFRAALPGVRGPPRTAAPRPPVLSPVPFHATAVPSSPR